MSIAVAHHCHWQLNHGLLPSGPTPELVTELAANVREQMDVTYCVGESGATGPTVPGPPFVHV